MAKQFEAVWQEGSIRSNEITGIVNEGIEEGLELGETSLVGD
jgi:hypothetical protein